MKKNDKEFLDYIKESDSSLFCIVGPNYSGKTYLINSFFDKYISIGGLLIDETGKVRRKVDKDEVQISKDKLYYIYQNEKLRGKSPKSSSKIKINSSSKMIIDIVYEAKQKVSGFLKKGKRDSLGIAKLMNIINILLTTNLNDIDYVIIDEPENSLDDNNLKLVIHFINILINARKKVIIVTHSPRLLELMQVKIDDIYKIKGLMGEIVNLKFKEVDSIYIKCGNDLKEIKGYDSIDLAGQIQINANELYRELYINNIIMSQDFYRILFYNDVVLMEGKTEELIIKETKYSQKYTKNIFYMDGKYKSFFLIEFFRNYCNYIYCFIDEDKKGKKDLNNNFSFNMNAFYTEKYKEENEVEIFYFRDNIEDEIGVDIEEVMIDFVGEKNKGNHSVINKCKAYIALRYIHKHPECVEKLELRTNKFDF